MVFCVMLYWFGVCSMVCWRSRSREGSSVRKERTDRRRLEEQPRLRSEVERNKPIRRCYYITVGHHWYFYSSHSNFLCFLAIFDGIKWEKPNSLPFIPSQQWAEYITPVSIILSCSTFCLVLRAQFWTIEVIIKQK